MDTSALSPHAVTVQVCDSCGLPWADHEALLNTRISDRQKILLAYGEKGTRKQGIGELAPHLRVITFQDCIALMRK